MRTPIEWAELHAPLFLSGTNLMMKLDPTKRSGLKMEYDEVQHHLYVTFTNTDSVTKTARIPATSVLSMIEAKREPMKMAASGTITNYSGAFPTSQAQAAERPFNPQVAQVSTPMSHVHAGLGEGQTGQEPPKAVNVLDGLEAQIKRGPGRPKKS